MELTVGPQSRTCDVNERQRHHLWPSKSWGTAGLDLTEAETSLTYACAERAHRARNIAMELVEGAPREWRDVLDLFIAAPVVIDASSRH